jgi:UDPglucose 6-dehydrogenase
MDESSTAKTARQHRLGVLGLGHVGLPTALGFAELGFQVVGTDNDEPKVRAIAAGKTPFYEPEMDELLQKHLASGRFRPLCDAGAAVQESDILFLCVGTPHQEDGSADLSQVEGAAQTIARNLNGYKLIVEKSTAPVHTARWIERAIQRYSKPGSNFEVACNPEFLREGTAMHDILHPDRVVIGASGTRARTWLREIYEPLGCPILVTDLNTAETIKHASNAFLATKISFVNMVGDLCEAAGADIQDVAQGLGMDPRIGRSFLQAGIGYGGFCLPKDVKAFIHVADEFGVNFSLLREVQNVNTARVDRFVRKVQQALWVLKDKTLAVWGLAFKPHTDDIREAPSIRVVRQLLQSGSRLRLYDPQVKDEFEQLFPDHAGSMTFCPSALDAATGAHAVLVLTEWPEFRQITPAQLKAAVAVPIVIDGRNCLDGRALEAAGFEYHGVGIKPLVPAETSAA